MTVGPSFFNKEFGQNQLMPHRTLRKACRFPAGDSQISPWLQGPQICGGPILMSIFLPGGRPSLLPDLWQADRLGLWDLRAASHLFPQVLITPSPLFCLHHRSVTIAVTLSLESHTSSCKPYTYLFPSLFPCLKRLKFPPSHALPTSLFLYLIYHLLPCAQCKFSKAGVPASWVHCPISSPQSQRRRHAVLLSAD